MASYALTCCSTADLTHEHFAARDIQYVCFHFTLNGETYPDDLGQSIPFPISTRPWPMARRPAPLR